jgi:hypothetical protein
MDEVGSYTAQIFDSIAPSVPGGAGSEKKRRMMIDPRTTTIA